MPTLTERFRAKQAADPGDRRKSRVLALAQAVLVVVLILLAARFVTVLVTSMKEEPVFSAPKTIYLPQRELQHQMAVSEFQNAAATPTTAPTLTTESLLANAPPLPQAPDVEFTPVESQAVVSESDALFGESGLMGALGALSSQASSVSFLGITEEAARFVVIIDVSTSVFNSAAAAGSSMEAVKAEMEQLINSLNANTLLGVILHRRTFLPMQDTLIPATQSNKAFAVDWVEEKFPESPDQSIYGARSGEGGVASIVPVLDLAFDMRPDVIFMISDGGYFASPANQPVPLDDVLDLIRRRQKDLPQDARIHAIHFPDPREIDDGRIGPRMRRIATRNDGKYRKFGD